MKKRQACTAEQGKSLLPNALITSLFMILLWGFSFSVFFCVFMWWVSFVYLQICILHGCVMCTFVWDLEQVQGLLANCIERRQQALHPVFHVFFLVDQTAIMNNM